MNVQFTVLNSFLQWLQQFNTRQKTMAKLCCKILYWKLNNKLIML